MTNSVKKPDTREEMVEEFMRSISRMSTWTVMFHGAVATRLGLNPTDLKCGGVLRETGPITAGELAELTGLTTGAITGVIDRLESAGFVRRAADPADRRRVIIVPVENHEQDEEMAQIFGPLAQATIDDLVTSYSEEELRVILKFISRAGDLMKAQTARLHREA